MTAPAHPPAPLPAGRAPRSLARAAARRQRELSGARALRRPDFAAALHRKWLWFLGPIAAVFIPAPDGWRFTFLNDGEEAASFLEAAWQVQAAAVGLSLAVAVFALQAAAGDSWRPKPAELAQATWADTVLALGVSSILVTGLALAGAGRGGPGGWSGSAAVVVGAGSLASLLPFWIRSTKLIAGGYFRSMRIAEIEKAVQSSVDCVVRERLALTVLLEHLEHRADFAPLELGRPVGDAVLAGRQGIVADIRLRRLARVLDGVGDGARIRGHIGLAVAEKNVLARVPADMSDVSDEVRRCFRIRRSQADGVQARFAMLHSLASQAIQDGDSLALEEVHEAYRSALLVYPRAWATYGQMFDSDAARSLTPFELPLLHHVQKDLVLQIVMAATGGDEQLASSALGLPFHVGLDAVELQAGALYRAMLDVLVHADFELARKGEERLGAHLRRLLTELVEYGPARVLGSHDYSLDDRLASGRLIQDSYRRLAVVARRLVERDDRDELRVLLSRWRRILQFFEPDPEEVRWQLDFLRQSGQTDPALEVELTDREQLEACKQELDRRRMALLLQLLGWVAHLRRERRQAPNQASQLLVTSLPHDVGELIELAEMDRFDDLLTEWIVFDRPEDANVGAIDSFGPLLDAVAVVGIASTDPGRRPELTPSRAISDLETGLIERTNELAADWPYPELVGSDGAAPRADALEGSIRAAAQSYRDHRSGQVIDTPLDGRRVQAFCEAARHEFESRRVLPRLLGNSMGLAERREGIDPTVSGAGTTLEREWFQGGSEIDISEIARQLGRGMAIDEFEQLVLRLLTAEAERVEVQAAIDEVVLAEITAQRERGLTPSIVLLPRHIGVQRQLRDVLERVSDFGSPEGPAVRHIGRIAGVDVYESQRLASNEIVIADLAHAGQWDSIPVQPEDETIVVAIHEFALDDAREAAEADDSYFSQPDEDDDVEARARRAAKRVVARLRVAAYLAIEPSAMSVLMINGDDSLGQSESGSPE